MNDGKVLIVTGGSRGIGAAVSRMAGKAGWRVALSYQSNREAADCVVSAIKAEGGEAIAFKADVGSEAEILALFSAVEARWGRLDGLVNNAGIVGHKQRVEDMTVSRLEEMMRVNVIGTMLCAREAVKRMSTGSNGGVIVNLSSVAAKLGSPNEYVDYAASKGAVDSFTKGLALEVAGDGIRVNAVRPGIIDTEIHASGGQPDRVERLRGHLPLKREGKADEVAEVVLFLLSDASSYVTGTLVDVAGGR